ncbi:MAG: sigma-54-dependent Fis family transcriptional regulator [Nitrospirae bacterium]|nr:sigma-54-dependent Fis family transcriptional regulator [Nitrospirota bacterium]
MEPEAKILVVDDDAVARDLLAEALRKEGYEVEAVAGGAEAIECGRQTRFDLVLTDMRMGAVDGIAVLRAFKQSSPDTGTVLLTAFGSMEGAIEAIKQGAYDYLAKPFKKEEIKLVVRRALEHNRLLRENTRFREQLRERTDQSQLVGSSPPMLDVYKLVARVATGKSTVLLEGESGTGKELIARAIYSNSPRRDRPFVPVNCAALPDQLLESELFGHEKGAFTGAVGFKPGLIETADGGTLFLDEIGDLGIALQVKLLRVIQEQEVRRVGGTVTAKVDVRIIAATNRDLTKLVKEGRFREDLFYRLNVVRILLPPLRERREDIPMLAHHFLQKFSGGDKPIRGFVPETMTLLQRHQWPGNVRELENVIERAVSLSHGPLVLPEDLPDAVRTAGASAESEALPRETQEKSPLLTLEEMEKQYLLRVLREVGGNKVRAAKILGIDRRTLYRMAERFGLPLGEEGPEPS